jgi:hypothetical protein
MSKKLRDSSALDITTAQTLANDLTKVGAFSVSAGDAMHVLITFIIDEVVLANLV